jgi:hypothetical protein
LIASLKQPHIGLSEGIAQATDKRIPVQVADLRNEPPVPQQAAPVNRATDGRRLAPRHLGSYHRLQ